MTKAQTGRLARPGAQGQPNSAPKRPTIAPPVTADVSGLQWLQQYIGTEFVYVLKFPMLKGTGQKDRPASISAQWHEAQGRVLCALHHHIGSPKAFVGNGLVRFVKGSYQFELRANRDQATTLDKMLVMTNQFAIPEEITPSGIRPFFHMARDSGVRASRVLISGLPTWLITTEFHRLPDFLSSLGCFEAVLSTPRVILNKKSEVVKTSVSEHGELMVAALVVLKGHLLKDHIIPVTATLPNSDPITLRISRAQSVVSSDLLEAFKLTAETPAESVDSPAASDLMTDGNCTPLSVRRSFAEVVSSPARGSLSNTRPSRERWTDITDGLVTLAPTGAPLIDQSRALASISPESMQVDGQTRPQAGLPAQRNPAGRSSREEDGAQQEAPQPRPQAGRSPQPLLRQEDGAQQEASQPRPQAGRSPHRLLRQKDGAKQGAPQPQPQHQLLEVAGVQTVAPQSRPQTGRLPREEAGVRQGAPLTWSQVASQPRPQEGLSPQRLLLEAAGVQPVAPQPRLPAGRSPQSLPRGEASVQDGVHLEVGQTRPQRGVERHTNGCYVEVGLRLAAAIPEVVAQAQRVSDTKTTPKVARWLASAILAIQGQDGAPTKDREVQSLLKTSGHDLVVNISRFPSVAAQAVHEIRRGSIQAPPMTVDVLSEQEHQPDDPRAS